MSENTQKTGFRGPSPDVGKPYHWKKGQSGNPGGRPKMAPLSQACRELLASPKPDDPDGGTYAEVIAQVLADKALAGDIRAAQELADRAEGRARQSIAVENIQMREQFERMSRSELEAYAREGKLPAWFRVEDPNHESVQ
jgi:hypothetical protein